jgi:hypothetical protein
MGMFDEIKVEHVLPGNTEITDEWYQTKSLENIMAQYVISSNGELYVEKWSWEWVGEQTHWLGGYMKKIEGSYRREYLTDFHGDVRFYSGKKPVNGKWRDYYARFTDGKLSKMWYKDED